MTKDDISIHYLCLRFVICVINSEVIRFVKRLYKNKIYDMRAESRIRVNTLPHTGAVIHLTLFEMGSTPTDLTWGKGACVTKS